VGPALDSYRCYRTWVWKTARERVANTLAWFLTQVTMPLASSTDLILAGIKDILAALHNPTPNSPLAPLTDSEVAALTTLTSVLTNKLTPAPHLEPATNPSPAQPPVNQPDPAATATQPKQAPTTHKPQPQRVHFDPTLPLPTKIPYAPTPSGRPPWTHDL
jgi:hypothetical protein